MRFLKRWFAPAVTSLALVATPATAAAPKPGDVVDAFHAAMAKGKRDDLLALMAPDAVVFEQGYVDQDRKAYSGDHLAADLAFAATVPREVLRRQTMESGEWAWVLTQTRAAGKFKDNVVDLVQTETVLLRQSGGKWLIQHIHWSGHEPPPPDVAKP